MIERILGTGIDNDDDEENASSSSTPQFANPSSNTELWWPSDLSSLQVRPTLEVFLQYGNPKYALAGVEIRVPPHASQDKQSWRNFGMNSYPLATQWTTFGSTMERNFRIEVYLGKKKEGTLSAHEEKHQEIDWENICVDDEGKRTDTTRNAIGKLGEFIATMDDTSPLLKGMHLISIPLEQEWSELPTPTPNESQTMLDEHKDENPSLPPPSPYQLVSIATSVPDALQELTYVLNEEADLEKEDDGVSLTPSSSSFLKVDIHQISSGSESQYLPECYKPLYKGT